MIQPNPPALDALIRAVDARRVSGQPPYMLMLGRECARAAGQPLETVSKSVLDFVRKRSSHLASLLDPGLLTSLLDPSLLEGAGAKVVDAVSALTAKLDKADRNQLLRKFYSELPVPLFYQDLASLLKLSYFREVLTTNYDDLLEQALSAAGLVLNRDFRVLTVDDFSDGTADAEPVAFSIVKLHGDLTRSTALVTADEIDRALSSVRSTIRQEIKGDIVVVGYTGESQPVEDLLRKMPGEMWWVSESPPDASVMQHFTQRDMRVIDGEAATPQRFFARLYEGLNRRPTLDAMKADVAAANPPLSRSAVPGPLPDQTDEEPAEYLQGRIRRAQRHLYELEQSLASDADQSVLAQVNYQQREVARLEDELRALPTNQQRLVAAVNDLVECVEKLPNPGPGTLDYARSQRDIVVKELQQPTPNHLVISAAIAAASTLSKRLDADAVKPSISRDLGTFASSIGPK